MKSRPKRAGTSINHCVRKRELGSTTLTVAVLIVFVGLVLATLLRLVLPRLAALLSRLTTLVSGLTTLLSGLTALLALSELVALLTFLLHIVCHKKHTPEKARS
jgi:type II secretory pathway component PulF